MANSKHLHEIVAPVFNQAFGQNLVEQFSHINNNFHKLAAMKMYAGEDGKSAIYIVYNLNAILFYPSVNLDGTTKGAFDRRRSIGTGTESTELAAKIAKVEEELQKDYDKYKELTGKSKEAYSAECWELYFGIDQYFPARCLYNASYGPDENSIYRETIIPGSLKYTGELAPLTKDGSVVSIPHIDWEHSICGCIREQYAVTNRMEKLAATPYVSAIDNKVHWRYATWLMDWALATNPGDASEIFVEHFLTYDPGKITVACTINDDSTVNFVGSLPYMHIDPRFRNTTYPTSKDLTDDEWKIITQARDITCVVYSEPVEKTLQFNVINPFPQLYLGMDGQWYWSINGENSNIPATGPAGEAGKNSQFVVVERMEQLHYYALGHKGRPYVTNILSQEGEFNPDLSNTLPHPIVAGYPYIDYSGPIGIAANVNQIRGGYNINALNEPAEDADFWPLFRPYYNSSEQIIYGKGWAQQYSEKFSTEKWNCLDSKFIYRVFGIAGGNIFWREYAEGDDADKYKIKIYEPEYLAKVNEDPYYCTEVFDENGKATGKQFEYYVDSNNYLMRRYKGESVGKYLYDLVPFSSDEDQAVLELMQSLDGCPCIVLPGQLYQKEHYQSTYWFSTLKLCPYDISESPTRFILTAYCSPENMFSTNLDEHSYAGLMMGLDVYEQRYNRFGALHNKPRGYMLPIGSRFIDSSVLTDASKEYSAHIMYSDLGAWNNRQDKDAADKSIDWKDIRVPDLTSEWKGIFDKHTMHIGSVMDYRALNDANIEGPAVPGRPGTGADHAGVGASANYDYRHNCLAELHIDEPVTITNFRDTYFKNILLDVESSLRVGNRVHINYQKAKLGIGGIYVDGVLSSTENDQGQAWYTNTRQEDVHYPYSAAGTPVNNMSAFKYRSLKEFAYLYPFLTSNTTKTNWNNSDIVGTNSAGSSSNEFDKVEGTNFWSALFRHGLGAQFLTSYNGIAIGGVSMQGDAFAGLKLMFSVDRGGNLQHLGKEWRSNTYTNWIWHTLWNKDDSKYHVNELQFMDSHEQIKDGFDVNSENYSHGCYMVNLAVLGTEFPLIYSSHKNIPGHVHTASRGFAGKLYGTPDENDVIDPTTFGNQLYNPGNSIKSIQVGDKEICPITTYEVWADVLCNNAALINQGLSPMPQSSSHKARYGAFTTFGQFIGNAARKPLEYPLAAGTITCSDPVPFYEIPQITPGVVTTDYLSKNDKNVSKQWWENVNMVEIGADYCDHYPGFGAIAIDNGSELLGIPITEINGNIGIGLYVRHGAFFESDLFVNRYARFMGNVAMASNVRVGKNLDVHENAHIVGNTLIDSNLRVRNRIFADGSVSANQYFRKGAKHGQFLMADGRSTRDWKDQRTSIDNISKQDFSQFTSTDGVKSPLAIDFGSVYRGARLGKFDIVRDVYLNGDNLKIIDESPDPDNDTNFMWLCQSPATSMRITEKKFYFFTGWEQNKEQYNQVTLNAFCNNCVAYIHMSFPLDYKTASADRNKKGWFGGGRYNRAYGIKVSDRAYESKTDRANWFTTLICDGFNWARDMQVKVKDGDIERIIQFPKPTHNVQAFVPSLYENHRWSGGAAANWSEGGTDAERSRQYGVIFDITPGGQLRIVDSNAPDALSVDNRIVTRDIWFVYAYEPKGYDPYMIFLTTDTSTRPANDESPNFPAAGTGAKVFTSTTDVDDQLINGTYDKYIWIKTYTGDSAPDISNGIWKTIEWSLYYDVPKEYDPIESSELVVYKFGALSGSITASVGDELDINDFQSSYKPIAGPSKSDTNGNVALATGDSDVERIFNKTTINTYLLKENGSDNIWTSTGIQQLTFSDTGGATETGTTLTKLSEVLNEYIKYKGTEYTSSKFNTYMSNLETFLDAYLKEKSYSSIIVSSGSASDSITHALLYASAEATVAAGIASPVTKVSATYGSLLIESDAYWSVFPIIIQNDKTPEVSEEAVTANNVAEPKFDSEKKYHQIPGTYSDDNSNEVGGYVIKNNGDIITDDDTSYYIITMERWGKSNGNWKCILTTDDILKDMWEHVKAACATQGFSWKTLNECYGQGTPVSPITIKFANALFVIQDIHGVDNVSDNDDNPQLTMYGFLRIFASQFKPVVGSHMFLNCYEVNTGINFVFQDSVHIGGHVPWPPWEPNQRTALEGKVNLLGQHS